jgi:hypothetical protein
MHTRISCLTSLGLVLLTTFLSSCGLKYNIQEPSLSGINYGKTTVASTKLAVVDKRSGENKYFVLGKLGPGGELRDISNMFTIENIKDPLAFLSVNLERELDRRGIPIKIAVNGAGEKDLVLEVERYQILNYRTTGFSPWEVCHVFVGTIVQGQKRTSLKAYFYNGKVPIWSMDELQEPCFSTPASVLIKDIASKINRIVFNLQAPEATVYQLTAEIDSDLAKDSKKGPLAKVLELGYTNTPFAIPALKKYSLEGDGLFQSGALSAIGILGAEDQLDFLKSRYENSKFNAKYMAVKAIGDIGSDKALDILRAIKKEKVYESEGAMKSCIDLYLP